MKGFPTDSAYVNLYSKKNNKQLQEQKTTSDGMFIFADLDPKSAYEIEIKTEYGRRKYSVENDNVNRKGVVDFKEIEAVENVALGKPVIFNFAKSTKEGSIIKTEMSQPFYYEIYSMYT
ncbi:MAG: hypothetical protein ABIF87_11085 [Pseudomonadota bacterium]